MRTLRLLLGVITLVCAATGLASAGVLLFDDFNGENGGVGGPTYTGFMNWNVTQGAVDLIGPGHWDMFPANGLSVDLDDSGQLASKTSFTLTPGTVYTLKYDLAGNQRIDVANSVTATLGSFSVTHVLAQYDPMTTFTDTFSVTSTESAFLLFDFARVNSDVINWRGAILDNVQLSDDRHPATVPEPGSTLLLLGSGLSALAALKRRWR